MNTGLVLGASAGRVSVLPAASSRTVAVWVVSESAPAPVLELVGDALGFATGEWQRR